MNWLFDGSICNPVPTSRKRRQSLTRYKHGIFLICLTLAAGKAMAAPIVQAANDFSSLSIEELADIEIASVSKKKEPLSDAAAAIFVITQEDIRRSGSTSIPEALRMAPNLQVARVDANQYAITARGFNGTANKLQRRTQCLYSALFRRVLGGAGRHA